MNHPNIEFEFINGQTPQEETNCYALNVFEIENGQNPCADHAVNEHFYHNVVMPLIQETQFSGKKGTVVSANCFHKVGKVILVGLGKKEAVDQEAIREAAGLLHNECVKLHSKSVVVNFAKLLDEPEYLKAFAEGILLAAHCDERFKSQPDASITHLKTVHFLHTIENNASIQLAKKVAKGVWLARELAHAPANYVTPQKLAQTAVELAERHALEVHVLEKEDCERLGMGAYLSVSQGSDNAPKFIHLCYKPKEIDPRAPFKKIALIGKGVTFDSGGLNLKVGAAQIELMKYDMSGAAAILGAAEAIGALKPAKEVHFIVAATENMINGKATRPGDVVTASNGKTIEIDNTDAEGRLTLADALVYAERLGVDAIVDLATLTGAMVVALGERIAGIFGTAQPLVDGLMAASPRTGEKIWPMPLETSYFESMKSLTADMRNTGTKKGGGSITAALFLQQFVKKTPWAHIDVAGTVSTQKAWAYNNPGATGFGVRLLVDWLLHG